MPDYRPYDSGSELWIGANYLPVNWSRSDIEGLYECIWDGDAQIGGLSNNHETLFGLRFAVPDDDPLTVLGIGYYGSDITGFSPPDQAPSLDEVVEVRRKLAAIGLELDPTQYFRFAEAYIPLEAKSAWEYASRSGLLLMTREASYGEPIPKHAPSFMGLRTWDDVDAYLREAWLQFDKVAFQHTLAPVSWHAMAVFPNSD